MERCSDELERAARWVREGGVAALTGAGISVDSGIPDFRSRGGLWERFEPEEYATVEALDRDPDKVWRMLREMGRLVAEARPNPGHAALARLEALGLLDAVITQNVDDLHQAAGSRRVVEFHGNARALRCLNCDARSRQDRPPPGDRAPRCPACGGLLRPQVVFFGEPIPPSALAEAAKLARGCRTMLVVGTSATVAPASLLPFMAKESGARLVEVNLEPTSLSWAADVSLAGRSASLTLPELVRLVEALPAS
ncbi:MAG: NAD-dependent deacylase [Deltaproteobacteria bacterium]|nr:NAD-dependent deacylase [Deltaproteobacteria bacterium]